MDLFDDNELPQGQSEEMKSSEEKTLRGKTYKCASCGNFLCYDPLQEKLACLHCKSTYELSPTKSAMELVYTNSSEEAFEEWEEGKAIQCRSCGATTSLEEYQTAVNCPFCKAPNIAEIDSFRGLKPNCILPFRIGSEKAHQLYYKWIRTRYFAPYKLRKNARTQDMQGCYIPCWTFDTDTFTSYTIRYGKHYTVVVGSGKNRRTETRTRWYIDSGNISDSFDDVQIEASKFITQKQLTKLGGYDTGNCVSYHNQFIAGYTAERYNKGLDESWEEAKAVADKKIVGMIKARYNADVIDYCNTTTSYSNTTYKYSLVPLWIIKYNYEDKKYGCMINGRNGKVTGKSPLSWIRVLLASVVGGGVVLLIFWLITTYLM